MERSVCQKKRRDPRNCEGMETRKAFRKGEGTAKQNESKRMGGKERGTRAEVMATVKREGLDLQSNIVEGGSASQKCNEGSIEGMHPSKKGREQGDSSSEEKN